MGVEILECIKDNESGLCGECLVHTSVQVVTYDKLGAKGVLLYIPNARGG